VSKRYHATNTLDSLNPMTEDVLRGGRYEVRGATMLDLIRIAYGVESDAVLGGPSWRDWDRFDVIAATPLSLNPQRSARCSRRCWPIASGSWLTTIPG